jgi:tRNA(fMet)-specific endonuclease VapC
MYLLDTSAIIEILNATESGAEILLELGDSFVAISPFTRYEYLYNFKGKRLDEEKRILRNLPVLDFTSECVDKAIEVYQDLKSKGKMINESDIYISALCILNGLTLVTLDSHFERIGGLPVKLFKFRT